MFANRARGEIRTAIAAIAILLIGMMGTYAWQRTKVFHDEESLWRDTLAKNPDAWQARARLEQYFFRQRKYSDAIEHLRRAVELKPELPEDHNLLGLASVGTIRTNLGNVLTIVGNNLSNGAPEIPAEAMRRYEEAIDQYEKALKLEPNRPRI